MKTQVLSLVFWMIVSQILDAVSRPRVVAAPKPVSQMQKTGGTRACAPVGTPRSHLLAWRQKDLTRPAGFSFQWVTDERVMSTLYDQAAALHPVPRPSYRDHTWTGAALEGLDVFLEAFFGVK